MCDLSEGYLRGAALFNAGKFFECHEAWEEIWLKAEGEEREFLHAMIQAAAALHHLQRGNLKGAQSLGTRAIEKLNRLPTIMMQLDTRTFRSALEQYLSAADVPPLGIRLL
ncbi:MAG: DUF309 domain-containing protein [Acidobacteriota bacterium]|nr:DUF309 domain-containing protein [Acidobacteriota bacterium]